MSPSRSKTIVWPIGRDVDRHPGPLVDVDRDVVVRTRRVVDVPLGLVFLVVGLRLPRLLSFSVAQPQRRWHDLARIGVARSQHRAMRMAVVGEPAQSESEKRSQRKSQDDRRARSVIGRISGGRSGSRSIYARPRRRLPGRGLRKLADRPLGTRRRDTKSYRKGIVSLHPVPAFCPKVRVHFAPDPSAGPF